MNNNRNRDENMPERGTREFNIYMLKKVKRWLDFMKANPKPNRSTEMLEDESDAVGWALKELDK